MQLLRELQLITEAAVNKKKQPQLTKLDVKEAVDILNTHCSDALWMLTEDKPFYRGDGALNGKTKGKAFYAVDPSLTVRQSQNTSNYYTAIFDNHPNMKDFPKRSKSYIASTYESKAYGYGNPVILIPYDNVKIGCVNKYDIWDIKVKFFGNTFEIDMLNDMFETMDITPTWAGLKAYQKLISRSKEEGNKFLKAVKSKSAKDINSFMDEIIKTYDPANTKMTTATTKTMKHDVKGEVWIGGPCVVITMRMWDALREEYKKIHG